MAVTYPQYLDFDLELSADEAGYLARVLASPKGEAEHHVTMPFDDDKLENVVLKLGRTRSGVRRLGSPQQALAKSFGASLYDAVFSGEVGTCFRRSLDEADRQGKGLRLRLRLNDAPALCNVPWEYLYPEGVGHFLVLSQKTPVIRYLDLPREVVPLAVQPPLRVLLVVSGPEDLAVLDTGAELTNMQTALGPLMERGLVQLDMLPEPSLAALRKALRTSTYHVLHFIGHGGYDDSGGDGVLAFEDEHGHSHKVSGGDLGTMLHDHTTLRLAVLNACEGARTSPQDPFSGVAQSLVQQGLPAVVAMQFEITDDAAIELSQEFYNALSDGYPVDAALAEGRKAVFGNDNDVEWGTPVLYLRASDGRIFDMSPSMLLPPVTEPAPEPTPQPTPEPTPEPEAVPPEVPAAAAVTAAEGWFRTEAEPAPALADEPVTAPAQPTNPPQRRASDQATNPPPPPAPPVVPPVAPQPGPPATESKRPKMLPVALVVGGVTLVGVVIALVIGGVILLGGSTGGEGGAIDLNNLQPTPTVDSTPEPPPPGETSYVAAKGEISVDGDYSDWGADAVPMANSMWPVAPDPEAAPQVTGAWWARWDEQYLYLLVGVQDPEIIQQHEDDPSAMWRGDGVSLEIGSDAGELDTDAGPRPGDAHVIFGMTPEGTVYNCVNYAGDDGDYPGGSPSDEIQTHYVGVEGGYGIEIGIPWGLTDVTPESGTVVSVNFNVSNSKPNGNLSQMVSSNPLRTDQQHPAAWQRMLLGG